MFLKLENGFMPTPGELKARHQQHSGCIHGTVPGFGRSPLASVPRPRHLKAKQRPELPFRSDTFFMLLLWNSSSFGGGDGLRRAGRPSETEIAGEASWGHLTRGLPLGARAWKCRGDRKDETAAGVSERLPVVFQFLSGEQPQRARRLCFS